jgi:hypothetical protein
MQFSDSLSHHQGKSLLSILEGIDGRGKAPTMPGVAQAAQGRQGRWIVAYYYCFISAPHQKVAPQEQICLLV